MKVSPRLGFAPSRILRPLRRLLGHDGPLGHTIGLPTERACEHADHQRDDGCHADAERDRRADEVIAGELLRQVDLARDLGYQQ